MTSEQQERYNKLPQELRDCILDLIRIDQNMSGDERYDHGWLNYPKKPEESAKDVMRKTITKLQDYQEWID